MTLNGEFENKALSLFHLMKWLTLNIKMDLSEGNIFIGTTNQNRILS